MGVGSNFAEAYRKAQLGGNSPIPESGSVFLSVREVDKQPLIPVARQLAELGFKIVATSGTAPVLSEAGIEVTRVNKVTEGRPHIVDMSKNGDIQSISNTTEGRRAIADSSTIRSSAEASAVYYTTTLAGGEAMVMSLSNKAENMVYRLQDLHENLLKL